MKFDSRAPGEKWQARAGGEDGNQQGEGDPEGRPWLFRTRRPPVGPGDVRERVCDGSDVVQASLADHEGGFRPCQAHVAAAPSMRREVGEQPDGGPNDQEDREAKDPGLPPQYAGQPRADDRAQKDCHRKKPRGCRSSLTGRRVKDWRDHGRSVCEPVMIGNPWSPWVAGLRW